VVIAVERSTRVGTAERRGPQGRDDGAEWVHYIDFSANPRVFLLTVELPLPTQEETLLDLTASVRVLSAYLRTHSQGCRSHFASTPSASNLLARGLLFCIHTRLQKRAELATGRTLSLASTDMLVQIRSDLRLRFAAFPPLALP
jgi:hypothetical protein